MIAHTRALVGEIGAETLFFLEALKLFLTRGVRRQELIHQLYLIGVGSLSTTLMAGLFVGAIMAIQINLQLRDFGAQGFLGGLATSTTIRDVGPVLIAFILSGKVGAFTSAELGTMRVTDQLDALRCLGTDPMEYVIVPRMCAVVISSFLLLIVGLMITIVGGIAISTLHLGVNYRNYVANISQLVDGWSIAMGGVKSFVFGLLIAVICCYRGYTATGGAEGVGQAVRRTAVDTLLYIIIVNYLISTVANTLFQILGMDSI